jgi:hypothetical protein
MVQWSKEIVEVGVGLQRQVEDKPFSLDDFEVLGVVKLVGFSRLLQLLIHLFFGTGNTRFLQIDL